MKRMMTMSNQEKTIKISAEPEPDILSLPVSTTLGKFLVVLSVALGVGIVLGYIVGFVFGKLH